MSSLYPNIGLDTERILREGQSESTPVDKYNFTLTAIMVEVVGL